MGIHGEARKVEHNGPHDVASLAAYSGDRDKIFEFAWHLSVKALLERLCHSDEALGFISKESRRLNQRFDPFRVGDRKICSTWILCEELRRDHVDTLVGALCRQNRRGQKFEGIAMVQRAHDVGIALCQDFLDRCDTLGSSTGSGHGCGRYRGQVPRPATSIPTPTRAAPATATQEYAELDRTLPGAEFVADAPEQFNDAVLADRRNPSDTSFDVVAPDGYLHAFQTNTPPDSPDRIPDGTPDGASDGTPVGPPVETPVGPPDTIVRQDSHWQPQWSLAVAAPRTTLVELLMAATSEIASRDGGLVTWWRANASESDDQPATRVGFARARAQHQLRVRLPISYDPNSGDGLIVSEFDFDRDASAWLDTNNAAFAQHPEQSSWTMELLEERVAEQWFDPSLFLIVRDSEANAIVGFNWMKTHPAQPLRHEPKLGEIYVIGVAPSAQGRGLGYALAGLGLRKLHERNITTGMLFVAADNLAALALYRRLGFHIHRTDVAYTMTVASNTRLHPEAPTTATAGVTPA